jgi:hypothetical protein
LRAGDPQRAWGLLVEAATDPASIALKVTLLDPMAECLVSLGRPQEARRHVQLSAAVRLARGWRIPQSTRRVAATLGLDLAAAAPRDDAVDLERDLMSGWRREHERGCPQAGGVVERLLPNGRAGFIRTEAGERVYFRVRSFNGARNLVAAGTKVSFRMKSSFDAVRQRPSVEAIAVRPRSPAA